MPTSTHLNVFPLGAYSMILGMDWLFTHRTKADCYEKVIEYLDGDVANIILHGKKKPTSIRMVTTM